LGIATWEEPSCIRRTATQRHRRSYLDAGDWLLNLCDYRPNIVVICAESMWLWSKYSGYMMLYVGRCCWFIQFLVKTVDLTEWSFMGCVAPSITSWCHLRLAGLQSGGRPWSFLHGGFLKWGYPNSWMV
jgi:hypothetical protein